MPGSKNHERKSRYPKNHCRKKVQITVYETMKDECYCQYCQVNQWWWLWWTLCLQKVFLQHTLFWQTSIKVWRIPCLLFMASRPVRQPCVTKNMKAMAMILCQAWRIGRKKMELCISAGYPGIVHIWSKAHLMEVICSSGRKKAYFHGSTHLTIVALTTRERWCDILEGAPVMAHMND